MGIGQAFQPVGEGLGLVQGQCGRLFQMCQDVQWIVVSYGAESKLDGTGEGIPSVEMTIVPRILILDKCFSLHVI